MPQRTGKAVATLWDPWLSARISTTIRPVRPPQLSGALSSLPFCSGGCCSFPRVSLIRIFGFCRSPSTLPFKVA